MPNDFKSILSITTKKNTIPDIIQNRLKNNNSHRQIGNNSIEKIQQKTIRRV